MLVCLVAALGGLLFGYDTGVINGAIGPLKAHFALDARAEGWATGCALLGCAIGAAVAGVLSDRLGRKKVLMISAILFFVSAVGTALPRDIRTFIIFRIVGGVGVGAAALLEEAARGMFELMDIELANGPRQRRRIVLDAGDREQLLVEFLDELLYLAESEEIGCDRYRLTVDGAHLEAMVEGVPIVAQDKEVKAVTYHRLEIEETENGLATRIVFDV